MYKIRIFITFITSVDLFMSQIFIRCSNLAKNNAKVTLNGVKNINGFTAVYSDRTDRAFQLQYDSGEIASIAFNNTGIWYDFYDGQNWKQVWKFNKPS